MSNYSWECRRNPLVRATMRYWTGRHVVYRHLSADGELLYVGVTGDPYERMKAHRRTSSWWPQVARLVIRVYPSRRAALDAERHAIASESPRYNAPLRSAA
jgi:predicted GIY-YIG superfamily endonuclease